MAYIKNVLLVPPAAELPLEPATMRWTLVTPQRALLERAAEFANRLELGPHHPMAKELLGLLRDLKTVLWPEKRVRFGKTTGRVALTDPCDAFDPPTS